MTSNQWQLYHKKKEYEKLNLEKEKRLQKKENVMKNYLKTF